MTQRTPRVGFRSTGEQDVRLRRVCQREVGRQAATLWASVKGARGGRAKVEPLGLGAEAVEVPPQVMPRTASAAPRFSIVPGQGAILDDPANRSGPPAQTGPRRLAATAARVVESGRGSERSSSCNAPGWPRIQGQSPAAPAESRRGTNIPSGGCPPVQGGCGGRSA